jgi:hypothetical protein
MLVCGPYGIQCARESLRPMQEGHRNSLRAPWPQELQEERKQPGVLETVEEVKLSCSQARVESVCQEKDVA